MKYLRKLFFYFSFLEIPHTEAEPISCNYSDDYYGDKKCVDAKE